MTLPRKDESRPLKRYEVVVSVREHFSVTVEAATRQEAMDKARRGDYLEAHAGFRQGRWGIVSARLED